MSQPLNGIVDGKSYHNGELTLWQPPRSATGEVAAKYRGNVSWDDAVQVAEGEVVYLPSGDDNAAALGVMQPRAAVNINNYHIANGAVVPADVVDATMTEQEVRVAYREAYKELQRMKSKYGVLVSQEPVGSVDSRTFDRSKILDAMSKVFTLFEVEDMAVPACVGDWNYRYNDILLAYALVGDAAMEWVVRLDMICANQPVHVASDIITNNLNNQSLAKVLANNGITGREIVDVADMAAVLESVMGYMFVAIGPAAVRILMDDMGVYKKSLYYRPVRSWGEPPVSRDACSKVVRTLSVPTMMDTSQTGRFVVEKALTTAIIPSVLASSLSPEARDYKSSLSGLGLAVLRTILMASCLQQDHGVQAAMVRVRDGMLSHANTAAKFDQWSEAVDDPWLNQTSSEKVKARTMRAVVGWIACHFCPETVPNMIFRDLKFPGSFSFRKTPVDCMSDLCVQCDGFQETSIDNVYAGSTFSDTDIQLWPAG